jgi:hypothetical protein
MAAETASRMMQIQAYATGKQALTFRAIAAADKLAPIYGDMGFLNPTGEITFPLSPTKLLMISPRDVEFAEVISGDKVHSANQARAAWKLAASDRTYAVALSLCRIVLQL